MRISDWSSDVCSSDLQGRAETGGGQAQIDLRRQAQDRNERPATEGRLMALEVYRQKRDLTKTAEPQGAAKTAKGSNAYLIQKQAARRLHYALRLEVDRKSTRLNYSH